jgi:ADP-ribose pyrophosphatase YjhB (NUDIX family)
LSGAEFRYCPHCATPLQQEERFGRLRPTCPACGWVHFTDPKVATAALVAAGGKVLLVRRTNEPYQGCWTLPAGFVDAGEDPAEAVLRELLEETGMHGRVTGLHGVLAGQEHARGAHILIVYRVELLAGELTPGDDVDRAAYFSLDTLPPLAFHSTLKILRGDIV